MVVGQLSALHPQPLVEDMVSTLSSQLLQVEDILTKHIEKKIVFLAKDRMSFLRKSDIALLTKTEPLFVLDAASCAER